MTPEELAAAEDARAEKKEEKLKHTGSFGARVWLVLFGLVALGVVVLFWRNREPVVIDYLLGTRDLALRSIILLAMIIGAVLDRLLSAIVWWSRRSRRKRKAAVE